MSKINGNRILIANDIFFLQLSRRGIMNLHIAAEACLTQKKLLLALPYIKEEAAYMLLCLIKDCVQVMAVDEEIPIHVGFLQGYQFHYFF
jgi:hypothetical protein